MGDPDAIVVGGGVIGQSIAWRAATVGLSVTLVDPEPGRGASWAAAGMLAPVAEAAYREEPLLRANLASHARWPRFAAALTHASGIDVGYDECGTLVVARDTDEVAALERLLAFRQDLGLRAQRLRSREVRRLEPGLAPGVRGAIDCPDDHQVDNRAVLAALERACTAQGVQVVREPVTAITTAGGRARGVRLPGGRALRGGAVVLAAGVHAAGLRGVPFPLPVRPVKGQLLHLRVPETTPATPALARRTIRGLDVYLVSRVDGRVVVGATVEERGHDRRATAGGVHQLLRDAYELVPQVAECTFVEATVGLRPTTPDNAPMVGPTRLEGLLVAVGHYRHGMLLAPLTAEGIVQLLGGGTVPDELAAFPAERFSEATAGVSA